MSKGSKRRPAAISEEQLAANWEAVFGRRKSQPVKPTARDVAQRISDTLIRDYTHDGSGWQVPDLGKLLKESANQSLPRLDCGHVGYLSIYARTDGGSQCTSCANRERGL